MFSKKSIITFFTLIFIYFLFPKLGYSENKKVHFSYAYNGRVYQGSFLVSFKLFENGETVEWPQLLDYNVRNFRQLKAEVEFSNLRFANRRHAKKYKLVFSDQWNEQGEGIKQISRGTQYFYSGSNLTIEFSFNNTNELSPTGFMLNFYVLDRNTSLNEMEAIGDAAFQEQLIIGLGFLINPIMIIPESYQGDEKEIISNYILFDDLVEEVVEELNNRARFFAGYLAEGNYTEAESFFEKESNKSRSELKVSPKSSSELGKEEIAFSNARKNNTRSAYQNFLSQFPNGKYASRARNLIVELTPFRYESKALGQGNYQVVFSEGVGTRSPYISFSNNGSGVIKHKWVAVNTAEIYVPVEYETEATFRLGKKTAKIQFSNLFSILSAKGEYNPESDEVNVNDIEGGQPPYKVVVTQNSRRVMVKEIARDQNAITLDASKIQGGPYSVKVLDNRKVEMVVYNGQSDHPIHNTREEEQVTGNTKSKKKLWLAIILAIPAISGIGFLLYNRYRLIK